MALDKLEIEVAIERALDMVQQKIRQTHLSFGWKADLRTMLLEEITHELIVAGLGKENEDEDA